jgi:hypothetical protein
MTFMGHYEIKNSLYRRGLYKKANVDVLTACWEMDLCFYIELLRFNLINAPTKYT